MLIVNKASLTIVAIPAITKTLGNADFSTINPVRNSTRIFTCAPSDSNVAVISCNVNKTIIE